MAEANGAAPPMRVALISGRNHPDYDLALAAVLAPGCDLLLCVDQGSPVEEVDAVGAKEVRRLPFPRHRKILGNLKLLWRLRREIRRFGPDVVHILSEGQVWLALLPHIIGKVPVVVTLHDVDTHPGDAETARIPRAFVDAFVRRADAVVVHGEGLRAAAVLRLSLPPERVFAAAHPLLWKYRRLADRANAQSPAKGAAPAGPDGSAPLILFFGRIAEYKGLEDLLEADAILGEDGPKRRIVIAGRGDGARLAALTAGREHRISVRIGTVPDEEAARLFAAADVLALPYREASQSGVLAIAPTFGLPVAATDVGEMGPMVRETGMGLVTPPRDPAAFAEALKRLVTDGEARSGFAARARAVGAGAFGPLRILGPTLTAYAFAQGRGLSRPDAGARGADRRRGRMTPSSRAARPWPRWAARILIVGSGPTGPVPSGEPVTERDEP